MKAREPIALLVVGAALLAWSGIAPADRTTWILEVFPIFIAAPPRSPMASATSTQS